MTNLENFTDLLDKEIENSQPFSLSSSSITNEDDQNVITNPNNSNIARPPKRTGECQGLRSVQEIDPKYRDVFSYQYFNIVQTKVIEDALYSDKSLVLCAPTGSGKTVIFEMAIVQLLMEMEEKTFDEDFKIIYMAPIKAICTERLTEWYPKFTKFNSLCIEVTGDTDVDFSQLKPYRIIITTPEKWDMLTRRWRDYRGMVEVIKLFLIDEVHILNDVTRGPVLEAVVSRMKTIQSLLQSAYRIEQLQKQKQSNINMTQIEANAPKIRFVAVSATISNPEDVAEWLGTSNKPAVFYKFGDECRPVKLKRVVEGYPCPVGTSIFKFDIVLNYKLWPIIQRYHNEKPTLIFCNTRKSVILTAEALSREITIRFSDEQKAKLMALASVIKTKKIQSLILCGIGCHHAGLLFEERINIERAFRNSDLPILITTTTLAMGVNLPAHLVIIKNTQQYVNGTYQEYSISTVLQMVGRAGRPQFDTEATAVIMTRLADKARYQALVGGCEPLQSYLHKRLAENLNSEVALGTVTDLAQCVQWVRSTFLFIRAARDPKKYLGLPQSAPTDLISKKIEELCMKAVNGLVSSGLITKDELCCVQSTEAGRLLSIHYLDLETMKRIMKIKGDESLEQLLWVVCESHELSDMHLRVDERRCLNALNRNNTAATIRFPMKGKINTRQMKLNCIIQAVLGCLPIHEPSLNQEAIKIMRIADRICKCLVSYVTRPNALRACPQSYQAVLNAVVLAKCVEAQLWENSIYISKQLKGIGPTYSALLATAGKINFMLLEESHPRDLERIMNKGPPSGNVLRKQINLLPKYQLTITPIDENSVNIQLKLLNQMYLAENIEHLTAGAKHKSYIIIGDSENYLLILASFKDKDLITIYGGEITYQTVRRHHFEHKIMAHCISSNFAGIDVQCEYLFQGLDTLHTKDIQIPPKERTKSKHIKQTAITDTFKIRKRKTYDTVESSTGEKKKCDFAIIKQIKSFTQSLDKSHNTIQKEMNQDINTFHVSQQNNFKVDMVNDDVMFERGNEMNDRHALNNFSASNKEKDDEHVNVILNEIEKEILNQDTQNNINKKQVSAILNDFKITNIAKKTYGSEVKTTKNSNKIIKTEKTNFNVIDKIQKKANNMKDNDDTILTNEQNTFVNSVKNHIDAFIAKAKQSSNLAEKNILQLLEVSHDESSCENKIDGKQTLINSCDKGLLEIHGKENDYFTNKISDNTLNINENDKDILILKKRQNFNVFKSQQIQKKDQNYTITNDILNASENNSEVSSLENKSNEHEDPNEWKLRKIEERNSNKTNNINNIDILKGSENNNTVPGNENRKNVHEDIERIVFEDLQKKHENNTVPENVFNIHEKDHEVLNRENKRNIYNKLERDILRTTENFEAISNLENVGDNTTKECVLQKIQEKDLNYKEQLKKKHEENLNVICVNPNQCLYDSNNFLHLNKVDITNRMVINYSNSFEESNEELASTLFSTASNNVCNDSELCLNNTVKDVSKNEENKEVLLESRHHGTHSLFAMKNDIPLQSYFNKLLDSTVSSGCEYMKKYSFTKTQVNIKDNYCIISKNKIDFDIMKNSSALEKDNITPVEQELSNILLDQNKIEYLKLNSEETKFENNNTVKFNLCKDHTNENRNDQEETSNKRPRELKEIPLPSVKMMDFYEESKTARCSPDREQCHTVKDVINKYKKIVSSKFSESDPTDCLSPRSSASYKYTKNKNKNDKEKFMRPFKIKDLTKIHESNSQNTNVPLVLEIDHLKFMEKISENIKDSTQTNKHESRVNEITVEPDIEYTQHNDFEDLESPDLQWPVIDNESPTFEQTELYNDNLDLSQSMFNPKSLLECLVQDDIILPPSQFCDKPKSDSPVVDVDYLSQRNHRNENIVNSGDAIEKDAITSLPLSSEIETWTLPRDDETWSSTCKSFTAKRNTPSVIDSCVQTTPSRKLKLNQFKFSRKNIFKVRK